MKAFVIDVGVCNGCYGCQFVCKDEHVGNDWAPIAKPQPDTGQFWMRLDEYIRGTVPKVRMHYVPNLCKHCDEAPCIDVVPDRGRDLQARRRPGRHRHGQVHRLQGVRRRLPVPLDLLQRRPEPRAEVHRLRAPARRRRVGRAALRRLVPDRGLKFGEESEFADLIAQAEVMKPELGTKPRVYYLNIPKKFIAGTVYDPIEKEVVIGATCTATPAGGGDAVAVDTDAFGDFWLNDLETGEYTVSIAADGFATKTFDAVSTEKDVNLGDVPLSH